MSDWDGNELDLGMALPHGSGRRLVLSAEDRARHMYVVGVSGSGKTRFLESLVRQDIQNWRTSRAGLLFIDPDGESYDRLMAWAADREFHVNRPIIPIDLRRSDSVVAYNPLRFREGAEASVIVNDVASAIANLWMKPNFIDTPLIQETVRGVLKGLYQIGGTLPDGYVVLSFAERAIRQAMLQGITDFEARKVWERANELDQPNKLLAFREELGSAARRFAPFFEHEGLRASLGQPDASLDLASAIDDGAIILLCLGQEGAQLSQEQGSLYATLLLSDLWRTIVKRGKGTSRKPFYIYMDEFQNFLTPVIAQSFNQARGYGLHFTLAHQFPSQLTDAGDVGRQMLNSVTSNAGTKVAFRLEHPNDLRLVADLLFLSTYDPSKRKLELRSPQVVEYERIILHGWNESKFEGGESESVGLSSLLNSDGEVVGTTDSSVTMNTDSRTSRGSSEHEALMPRLEERVTSVQFFSIEEQAHLAMATLKGQNPRFGTVLMPKAHAPEAFQTRPISKVLISARMVEQFYVSCTAQLPFVLERQDAVARLRARQEALKSGAACDGGIPEHPLPPLRSRGA